MTAWKNILLIFALTFLSSCGSMQKKIDKLTVGDPQKMVIEVLGQPDDTLSKGDQEAWRYCISGAGYGWNDHRDIIFYKGNISKMDAYKSHTTGCTNGFESVKWYAPKIDFSIEQAKDTCKQLGFTEDYGDMPNCLLMQQKIQYDSQ